MKFFVIKLIEKVQHYYFLIFGWLYEHQHKNTNDDFFIVTT